MVSTPSPSDKDSTRQSNMDVDTLAAQLAQKLQQTSRRLVLAESCTAGLISATLGRVAGISAHFCGSAVVYRDLTKVAWLDVDEQQLAEVSAVSPFATTEIARSVLQSTPEANVSLGITGHFGPDAPDSLDGAVFWATYYRNTGQIEAGSSGRWQLSSATRQERQAEATALALSQLLDELR